MEGKQACCEPRLLLPLPLCLLLLQLLHLQLLLLLLPLQLLHLPLPPAVSAALDTPLLLLSSLAASRPQVGLSLGVVGVSVDASGRFGAASSLDSYVTVWSMEDYSTGD